MIYLKNGTISSVSGKDRDVILNIGTGSIRLQYARKKFIQVKDSANNDSYIFFDGKDTVNALFIDSEYFNGTSGNDYIVNYNRYNVKEVNAGAGDDTIASGKGIVNAGDGNDRISYADTIIGGKGDDTISSFGGIIQYADGDGNDVVEEMYYDGAITLQITSGEVDSLISAGNDAILNIGTGSIRLKRIKYVPILIQNSDNTVTYTFYDGETFRTDKEITYNKENTVVSGTGGDDYIFNMVKSAKINSYGGNDTITSAKSATTIDAGDGNNVINAYGWDNSIKSGSGNDIINADVAGSTVNAGMGNDTLNVSTSQPYLIQYVGGDDVLNHDYVFDYGGCRGTIELASNNSISDYSINGTTHVLKTNTGTITINDVNNYEYNNNISRLAVRIAKSNGSYDYIRYVNGEAFNDITHDLSTWYSHSNQNIGGTSGKDYIEVAGDNFTVDSGKGDDYINNTHYIDHNRGQSLIKTGAGNDTVYIVNSTTVDGGDGNDLIQHVAYRTINYDGLYYGKTTKYANAGASLNGGTGDDVIEVESRAVTVDYEFNEEGIAETGNFKYNVGKNVTVIGGKGDDTIRNAFINKTGNYSRNYEGDTFVRSVSSYFKSANTYVTVNKITDEEDGYYYKTTATSTLIYDRVIQYANGDGNDIVEDYHESDTIQLVGNPNYTMDTVGNDVVIKVGTGSIKLLGAKGKNIFIGNPEDNPNRDKDEDYSTELDKVTLTNKDKSPYTATSMVGTIDASTRTLKINITGNDHDNVIIGGKGKDTLTGGTGNDTFVTSAGKDIITDYAEGDVVSLSGALSKVTVSKNNVLLTVDKVATTIKDAKGKKITIVDTSGYSSKQTYGEKSIAIADGDGKTIDTTLNTAAITLDSSSRTEDLNLIGNSKANVIQLGSGNSTVTTGKGKDTIIANATGNLNVVDYTVGQDKLKFSVDISNVEISGSDVVFTLGTGKVTVQGANDKKITVIDKDGVTTSQVYGATEIKLVNADGATIKAIEPIKTIDSSKRTKPVSIIGNALDNTIISGKKNDTLTGGSGADVFVYTKGNGNDVITDYTATDEDIIQLGAKTQITGAKYEGNDLVLSIGSSKLTVQGGASQNVTVVDENDLAMIYMKYNRNSKATGFEERWFLDDAECGMQNSELDSIVNSKDISLTSIDYSQNKNPLDVEMTNNLVYNQNKKSNQC